MQHVMLRLPPPVAKVALCGRVVLERAGVVQLARELVLCHPLDVVGPGRDRREVALLLRQEARELLAGRREEVDLREGGDDLRGGCAEGRRARSQLPGCWLTGGASPDTTRRARRAARRLTWCPAAPHAVCQVIRKTCASATAPSHAAGAAKPAPGRVHVRPARRAR